MENQNDQRYDPELVLHFDVNKTIISFDSLKDRSKEEVVT